MDYPLFIAGFGIGFLVSLPLAFALADWLNADDFASEEKEE